VNQIIARGLLAIFCALQGVATAAIDLSRTHATNSTWPGHARFHVVWQTASTIFLAIFELGLLLVGGPFQDQRFYLAAILAVIPVLGFFTALIGRNAYRGTLSDPNGVQPLIIRTRDSVLRIDLNLAAEITGLLALAAIVAIYRYGGNSH
jgi:hypothetical protein